MAAEIDTAYLPTQDSHTATSKNAYATSRNSNQHPRPADHKLLTSDTLSQSSIGSKVSYGHLSRAKPPSSTASYKSTKSKVTNKTSNKKAYRVIEWYFYPEFAPKKLFKNLPVQQDLRQVTGRHYEVLSQASNTWSQSSKAVPISNSQ